MEGKLRFFNWIQSPALRRNQQWRDLYSAAEGQAWERQLSVAVTSSALLDWLKRTSGAGLCLIYLNCILRLQTHWAVFPQLLARLPLRHDSLHQLDTGAAS